MNIRQILLIIAVFATTFSAMGNSKADALRKSLYEAPDSAKAAILVNIAKVFQYERVDSCIYYATKASEKAQRTRQNAALIEAETLLSQIDLERKDYFKATVHQRVILEVALRMRDWDLAMQTYNAIAQTWLLRNNYAEAVEYLKKGLAIAKDRDNLELQKYYYQALIDSYSKLHNMGAVCEYYPLLMAVNQREDAEAYNNRINALQTERETLVVAAEDAKKWGQQRSTVSKVFNIIAIVWAILATAALVAAFIYFRYKIQPGIIKTQKALDDKTAELQAIKTSQEKTFRFLSNHIYTSINALGDDIGRYTDVLGDFPVPLDSPLNRINGDIFSLYGFFQNLLLMLQAQAGQLTYVPVTVNIPQQATNLLTDYDTFASAKGIMLVNEVQNNTFAIGDERLIDIVLRNMMSNAFKYAPRGTGRITVGTKVGTKVETREGMMEDAGYVEVWVTDDGIGLTPEQADKLFDLEDNLTLPGDTKGYGAGLAVCKAVIETFKGRIWAETKPGEGFCIRFSLPRAKEIEVKTLGLVENTQDTSDNFLLE